MLTKVSCSACGRETTAASGRCEWCGAALPLTTQAPVRYAQGDRSPEENSKLYGLICGALAVVFGGAGLFVIFGRFGGLKLAAGFGFAEFLLLGIGGLLAAALFSALAFDLARRARSLRRCEFCGGPMQLVGVRDEDDPTQPEYREFLYRCQRCGRDKVVVDA
jgi:hypothetical protein